MNKYETPILNIISFENEDIIRTSGEATANVFGNPYNSDNGDFWKDNI